MRTHPTDLLLRLRLLVTRLHDQKKVPPIGSEPSASYSVMAVLVPDALVNRCKRFPLCEGTISGRGAFQTHPVWAQIGHADGSRASSSVFPPQNRPKPSCCQRNSKPACKTLLPVAAQANDGCCSHLSWRNKSGQARPFRSGLFRMRLCGPRRR